MEIGFTSRGPSGIFGSAPSLPTETVSEILYWTDLLSLIRLSRTSVAFYLFLQSPHSNFIWHHARKTFYYPMPGPVGDGWSEAGWARWVLGGGPCSNCGIHTDSIPWSFVLRLRVCDKRKCMPHHAAAYRMVAIKPINLDKRLNKYVPLMNWLPAYENDRTYLTGQKMYTRSRLDWAVKHVQDKIDDMGLEGAGKYFAEKAKQLPQIEDEFYAMMRWKVIYQARYLAIQRHNKKRVKVFSKHLKIRMSDLYTSRTFKETLDFCMNSREKFSDHMFLKIRDTIKLEALAVQEERRTLHKAQSCIVANALECPVVLKGRSYRCLLCIKAYADGSQNVPPPPVVVVKDIRGKGKNGLRGCKWKDLDAKHKASTPRRKQTSPGRAKVVYTWDGLKSHVNRVHNIKTPRQNVDYIFEQEEGEIVSYLPQIPSRHNIKPLAPNVEDILERGEGQVVLEGDVDMSDHSPSLVDQPIDL